LIDKCKDDRDVDSRTEILRRINSILPGSHRVKIPSLITNDYINTVLYRIEEHLSVTA
jgi:hypothetical protein